MAPHAGAGRIVEDALTYSDQPQLDALAVVAALSRAGWLHDPARWAALEAVAMAARDVVEVPRLTSRAWATFTDALATLDESGSGS